MNYSKNPARCANLLECVSGRKWIEIPSEIGKVYARKSDFILFREDNGCKVIRKPHGNMDFGVEWAICKSSDYLAFTGDDLLVMLGDSDVQRYISTDSFATKEGHDERTGAVHFSLPEWDIVWPLQHRERILAKEIKDIPWWKRIWF